MEKELVRSIARAFYETEHTVIIDALVKHSACTLDDLRHVFIATRHNKDILKLLAKLKDGGLVSSYARQEIKVNAQKATTIDYLYVDYRRAVDATNYRLHMLQEKLVQHSKPTTEKREFACPQCRAQWTLMEVLENRDPAGRCSGFLCNRCTAVLKYSPPDKDDEIDGDNPLSLFNKQFDWLIKILRQLDQTVIPEVTAESALEAMIPVPKPKAPPSLAKPTSEELPISRPTAVMGIKSGPEKVEITLSTDQETTAAAQQAEIERKAKIASQNELPSWHTQSTVTTATTSASSVPKIKPESGIETGVAVTNSITDADAEPADDDEEDLEQFYKEMAEHQRLAEVARQQDERAQTDEDEDEDYDDDEDFEEVEPLHESKKIKVDHMAAVASTTSAQKPVALSSQEPVAAVKEKRIEVDEDNEDEDDEEFEEVV